MPSRRSYLAALGGGFASLSGCLVMRDDSGSSTSTSDGNGSPGSPTEPSSDAIVVEDIDVRKAVTYESTMGSGGVLAAADQQYVVATVKSVSDGPSAEFTFETDGESFDPGLPGTVGAMNRSVAGHGGRAVWRTRVTSEGSPYYLAFAVPSPLDASNPRIRATGEEGSEWPLPDDARNRLAAEEPRFELETMEAPSEISQGHSLTVALTVTNVSGVAGRFLAAIYWPTNLIADDDESHVVEREVGAGETVTVATDVRTRFTASEDGPMTLSVQGHVEVEREVRVQDTSTPS